MESRKHELDKAAFRKQMGKQRSGITGEQRALRSAEACSHGAAWLEGRGISSFMVYLAIRSELDLTELIEWGWRTGRQVVAPRCHESDRSMTLYHLESWSQLEQGAYGIMEPSRQLAREIPLSDAPEAIFVPGLAFDRRGGRLGYGGGYYDRFAQAIAGQREGNAVKPIWIGAAYEEQLTAAVPLEEHDAVMDGIVTERQLYIIE